MKKYSRIVYLFFVPLLLLSSCLKEEIPSPRVEGLTLYFLNDENQYVEVTTPVVGTRYVIGINSDADIVTLWPGGKRQTMKTVAGTDSVDINGNVILITSDHFSDYGLLNARGLTTSFHDVIGWNAAYTFSSPGKHTIVSVATNHGYDSNVYDQRIFEFEVDIQ